MLVNCYSYVISSLSQFCYTNPNCSSMPHGQWCESHIQLKVGVRTHNYMCGVSNVYGDYAFDQISYKCCLGIRRNYYSLKKKPNFHMRQGFKHMSLHCYLMKSFKVIIYGRRGMTWKKSHGRPKKALKWNQRKSK
jgi:hypothetical protein